MLHWNLAAGNHDTNYHQGQWPGYPQPCCSQVAVHNTLSQFVGELQYISFSLFLLGKSGLLSALRVRFGLFKRVHDTFIFLVNTWWLQYPQHNLAVYSSVRFECATTPICTSCSTTTTLSAQLSTEMRRSWDDSLVSLQSWCDTVTYVHNIYCICMYVWVICMCRR